MTRSRVEFFGAGVAAGTGADGVRLVDDEQSAVLPREFAQRLMKTGRGMDDADVGQGGFREDAGYVAVGERLFESGDVVEFDDASGYGGSTGGPTLPRRGPEVPSG